VCLKRGGVGSKALKDAAGSKNRTQTQSSAAETKNRSAGAKIWPPMDFRESGSGSWFEVAARHACKWDFETIQNSHQDTVPAMNPVNNVARRHTYRSIYNGYRLR